MAQILLTPGPQPGGIVFLSALQVLLLIPVVCGSIYGLLSLWAVLRFMRLPSAGPETFSGDWPPVTLLKPVCGMEKGLRENLRSSCLQDYPAFQVVFSVQRLDDPAVPLLEELRQEFGRDLVTVAVEQCVAGPNGKINNLIGGLKHARHEILVISDSDVRLRPNYLKTIVRPLSDPKVGYACTLYKAVSAGNWFEQMELLTINADLTPNMVFALVTGASKFCLGASTALRRATLESIGGLHSLADYLVEDYEMGRRIWSQGRRMVILPYLVETVVDLKSPRAWWNHLVYWDQNNRAARPVALFSTVLIRPVPFALLFALSSLGSLWGLAVLAATVTLRVTVAGIVMRWGLRDREGPRALWLLPFRDIAALASWVLAFTKRTTIWRDVEFILTKDGRLKLRENAPCAS